MKWLHITRLILIVHVAAFISSCDHNEPFEPEFYIHENFEGYVEAFIEEASIRGIDIEIDNLIIDYDSTLLSPYCGECNSHKRNVNFQKFIHVNPNISCWDHALQAEAFIFHELGHCILGRLHLEDTLPNGAPKSLMISDNISVYSPCVYQLDPNVECNFTYRRDYYIDELFDPETPVPEWALNSSSD
jgi:hypothetical protein